MHTQRIETPSSDESDVLNPIKIRESAYQYEIPASEKPFLNELNQTWKATKPFEEKKVLVNAHLTLITLDLVGARYLDPIFATLAQAG